MKILNANKSPITISKDKNFKIVVISDPHIGSNYGYLPKGCTDTQGNEHFQNIDQVKMEKNLLSELDNIGHIDVLITLGDMVEGKNAKACGFDIGNTDTSLQVEWSCLFLKSVVERINPDIILGLAGSDYHVENNLDFQVIKRCSLEYPNKKMYYGNQLKFILGEKLWFLNHRCTEGSSKAGTLERYWKDLNQKHWDKGRTPDVIGYGHIHQAQNPFQIKNGPHPVYGFICPCQKMPDSFCGKNQTGTFWEIGFLKLEQKGVKLSGEYVNTYEYWKEKQ